MMLGWAAQHKERSNTGDNWKHMEGTCGQQQAKLQNKIPDVGSFQGSKNKPCPYMSRPFLESYKNESDILLAVVQEKHLPLQQVTSKWIL